MKTSVRNVVLVILLLTVLIFTGCDERSVSGGSDDSMSDALGGMWDFVSLVLIVAWASSMTYLVAYPYWKERS